MIDLRPGIVEDVCDNLSQTARKSLIPFERRDVRVVEGARLESEACEERRRICRDLNAHALNELAAWKYLSV